jgi:hypothetical protein
VPADGVEAYGQLLGVFLDPVEQMQGVAGGVSFVWRMVSGEGFTEI